MHRRSMEGIPFPLAVRSTGCTGQVRTYDEAYREQNCCSSGGEKAKVRLCKLINRETNLLVLDEPTNHLDVDAKDELKRALKVYKGSILLISHEPEFYRDVVTETWNCESWTTKVF